MSAHPLLARLEQAARGTFPPADGRVDVLRAVDGFRGGVTAFTGQIGAEVGFPPRRAAAQ